MAYYEPRRVEVLFARAQVHATLAAAAATALGTTAAEAQAWADAGGTKSEAGDS